MADLLPSLPPHRTEQQPLEVSGGTSTAPARNCRRKYAHHDALYGVINVTYLVIDLLLLGVLQTLVCFVDLLELLGITTCKMCNAEV